MEQNNGISPSFDEMRIGVGLRSKSGVHRLVTSLNERGYIRRLYHRARSIEVIRMPGGLAVDYVLIAAENRLLNALDNYKRELVRYQKERPSF